MHKEIRLKLKAFDNRVLDRAVTSINDTVKNIGVKTWGAIPLPVKRKRFIVNRSTHVDKKSREQFEIRFHSRLLIVEPSADAIDALMKLDLPSGVDVEIKLIEESKGK